MSRIGKQPIKIPEKVTTTLVDNLLTVKGPKGEISYQYKSQVEIKIENGLINLTVKGKDRLSQSLHGLYRTLIDNMIHGVTLGWSKGLEISGVGFRAMVSNNQLVLSVGYSHTVDFPIPAGITIIVKESKIEVQGIDKQLVGETAAKIRRIKPPEPYKGKGIHYLGEHIRRKAGKVVKAASATAGK